MKGPNSECLSVLSVYVPSLNFRAMRKQRWHSFLPEHQHRATPIFSPRRVTLAFPILSLFLVPL